jgi:hypothetical protein
MRNAELLLCVNLGNMNLSGVVSETAIEKLE